MRIVSRKKRRFQENPDHTTYYNKKGEIVPSVTTVIKVIAKDGLVYWANNLGWKRKSVKKELDDSSEIGTYAHNYIEAVLKNSVISQKMLLREIDLLPEENKNMVLNSINSFNLWWKDNNKNFKTIECEKEMSCDEYGGTIDWLAEYRGKTVIIDFKTSKSFYYTMYLQLAAYAHMYKYNNGKSPANIAILKLDKVNGKKAKLKWVTDLPNGDIDFYYISYKRALELYKNIHILEQDWANM